MCLIIHNPKGEKIPYFVIENAMFANQDGFGIFYHDTREIITTLDYIKADEMLDTTRPYTAHFRYATSGVVDTESCHPFHINDTYALMMNGTIERLVSKSKVDTEALCEILNGMNYKQMTNVLSTYSSRFALINKETGRVSIINKDLWSKRYGALFSKDNAFYTYSSKRTTSGAASSTSCAMLPKQSTQSSSRVFDYEEDDTYWNDWCRKNGYYDEIEDDEGYDPLRDADENYPVEWPLDLTADLHKVAIHGDTENMEEEETPEFVRVAVYGTLKEGYGNHHLLDYCDLIGHGTTLDQYPMVGRGVPFLIDDRGKGHNVVVEVYAVDPETLISLDSLEGHPNNYERRVKPIMLDEGGTIVECLIYMIDKHLMGYVTNGGTEEPLLKCF